MAVEGREESNREVYTRGGGGKLEFRFFSIIRHASTQLRMPVPRGMASQHLLTFERVLINKELLTRPPVTRVPVNNLFHKITNLINISLPDS